MLRTSVTVPELDVFGPGFHVDSADVAWARSVNWYATTPLAHLWKFELSGTTVLRYDAVRDLMTDPRLDQASGLLMASDLILFGELADWWQMLMLNRNGAVHARLRKLTKAAIAPAAIEALRPVMRATAHRLIDAFPTDGSFDFTAAFALPYPLDVWCHWLGVPESLRATFTSAIAELGHVFAPDFRSVRHQVEAALSAAYGVADELIAARRRTPGDDLVSALLAVDIDGDHFTAAELRATVVGLPFADSSRYQIGLGLAAFIDHPAQWDVLRARPELAARAVTEIVRVRPAIPSVLRIADESFDVGDLHISVGELVILLIASANTDPAAFGDAPFDIAAERANPPLTFGHGLHACLGNIIARIEMEEGFRILAERVPRFVPADTPTWLPGITVAGPITLPVATGSVAPSPYRPAPPPNNGSVPGRNGKSPAPVRPASTRDDVSPPSLPQNDTFVERAERELALGLAREIFAYDDNPGVPMPLAQTKAAFATLVGILPWFGRWLLNQGVAAVDIAAWKFKMRDELTMINAAAYADVFATYPIPQIATAWQDDTLFATQRVAGLNVLALTRLGPNERRVVAAFDDAVLAPFLGAGATFERAIAEQRLFVADYAALGEITADATAPGWQAGRKLIAPVALFVQTDRSANLEPVGIDLGPNRMFLAQRERTAGNDDRWAIAKMFVQSADYNYNQVVNHLAFTHLIEESICLAVYRRLAPQHPVTRLLARHFTALLAINQIGVFTLISKNGIIAHILEGGLGGSLQLIANAYRNWSFDDLDFPAQIARRGLGDPTVLPYYPYRDDGMLIWNLIGEYVEQYVALYYGNDDAVASDYELQGFAQQLGGLLDGGAGGLTGFPAEIVNCEQLCTVLRRIIWTAGPQHAAVNYPQIDFATFVPNLPAATYAPPPEAGADIADLTAWLPPQAETQTQVHTGYSLAGMHYDRFLRYRLCRADGSQALVDQFHARLVHDVRPVIVARNAERARTPGQLTYPYFLPENIPNSTSV